MYNKKVLSTAKKELNKAKAPKKPKDIITDPMGQWKYPGLPTRIPGNDITMEGVGYPVLGVANNGQKQMMQPGEEYTFPGADYVDEYPQMRKGGTRKRRKTKSLSGTNKLMLPNPLLRNYKNRVYDPNVDYFQDGGFKTNYGPDNDQENFIKKYWKEPNYKFDSDGTYYDPVSQTIHIAPEHRDDTAKMEHEKMHHFQNLLDALRSDTGTPLRKPTIVENQDYEGEHYYNRSDDEFEHTKNEFLKQNPEFKFVPEDVNYQHIIPSVYNNPYTVEGEGRDYENYIESGGNSIFQDGGSINLELTDDEIEEYRKGGYIVEDISVPELDQAQKGKTVKSKDGTITNTITKANGDTVIQVKNKNGEYYEKLIKKSDALDTLSKLQGAVKPEFQVLGNAKAETNRQEKEEKKEKQKFLKKAWSDYDKLSTIDKASDRVGAFLNDPFGMTARAMLGKQAYIPGMGQGLHDNENPEIRERYLKELGYTPGEFDASDVQNMINPGYWASSFTENSRKGNIGTAALEGALMFLPHLPQGTISRSNIRSGANMLKNDVKNAGEYLTTKTPLKNAYRVNPWAFKANPESYYRMIGKEGYKDAMESGIIRSKKQQAYPEPYFGKGKIPDGEYSNPKSGGLNPQTGEYIPARGYPGPYMVESTGKMKGVGAFKNIEGAPIATPSENLNAFSDDFKFYKQHWLKGYKEVPKELPGSPNAISRDNVVKAGLDGNFLTRPLTLFTKNEMLGTPENRLLYRKIGNAKGLQDLIDKGGAQAPAPMRMTSGATIDTPFFGPGSKPNENYRGLFAVEIDPANPKYKWSNYVAGTQNKGVAPYNPETGELVKNIPLEDLNVYKKKWFSNNYKKLKPEELKAALVFAREQALIENAYKWGVRGTAADQIFNDGNYGKAIQNYFLGKPNTSRKKRVEAEDDYEKGGIVADLTPEEIQDYIAQGYTIEELDKPKLNQAQKGGIKTHKSEDGTITNTITKANGDVVIQVKTKDGKYYEKVKHGLPQFVKDEFKKRADWENRSSGMAQPVDDFWTLPMGMSSAGVKGAGALAKGAGTLLKNAGKSNLVQLSKAGTKAFFNNTPKWITKVAPNLAPGINLNNLLTSYGIVEGANAYLDKDSDVRKANKKAYKNPNYNTITDALGENIINSLDFSGLAAGNKIGKLTNYITKETPLKNIPNLFKKDIKYVNLQDQINDIVKNSSFKTEGEAFDYLIDHAKKNNKNVDDLLNMYSSRGFGFSHSNPIAAAEMIKNDIHPYVSPYLYHGTSDARLKSILESGLDNSKGKAVNTGGMMADVLGGGKTTAAGDMRYAKSFSEISANATEGKPVILRFKNKNKENLGFVGMHPSVKGKDIEYSFDGGKTWNKGVNNTNSKSGIKSQSLENEYWPKSLTEHPDMEYVLQKTPVKDFKVKPVIENLPTKKTHGYEVTKDEVYQLINQNLEYLTDPEYIKRRQLTTKESPEKIQKEINKYIENLKRSKIDFNTLGNFAGVYKPGKRKILNPFKKTTPHVGINPNEIKSRSHALHVLDHEIGHALSPISRGDFKGLPKYKNYPNLRIAKEHSEKGYLSSDYEQQVRLNRIKNYLYNKHGVSKNKPLSEEDFKLFTDDYNKWMSESHDGLGKGYIPIGMGDISDMLSGHIRTVGGGDKTRRNVRAAINKSWGLLPVGIGAGLLNNSQNQKLNQKKKGGIVAELTDDEIQDYIKQGYIVEDVD